MFAGYARHAVRKFGGHKCLHCRSAMNPIIVWRAALRQMREVLTLYAFLTARRRKPRRHLRGLSPLVRAFQTRKLGVVDASRASFSLGGMPVPVFRNYRHQFKSSIGSGVPGDGFGRPFFAPGYLILLLLFTISWSLVF